MAKLQKKAEIIEKLHAIVRKNAEAQEGIDGSVLTQTNPRSISDEHDTFNKNEIGPEKLNDEQGYKQEMANDESEPAKGAIGPHTSSRQSTSSQVYNKSAEELAEEILATIKNKSAEASKGTVPSKAGDGRGSGEVGKDTGITAISDKHDTINKNDIGPENLNDEQGYEQHKATDPSEPAKAKVGPHSSAGQKSAEEVEKMAAKIASFELGKQFAETLIKQAAQSSTVSNSNTANLLKEAGRRDFDLLIAQAQQELETNNNSELQEKQAEEAGAYAFDEMFKQAQLAATAEENAALKAKLAELENKQQAELSKEAEEQKEAKLVTKVAQAVIEALKSEPAPTSAK